MLLGYNAVLPLVTFAGAVIMLYTGLGFSTTDALDDMSE